MWQYGEFSGHHNFWHDYMYSDRFFFDAKFGALIEESRT
jgi:hypothetical protein